jgi:glycosyltransferase involved in cell wall biosynthesis
MEGKKNTVSPTPKKILIITYYWPPSGGSGVQRWMYFAKHLRELGWEPVVITVDESQASYPTLDLSLLKEVEGIRVIKTQTREPLRWYSRLVSGNDRGGIPQGVVKTKSLFGKIAAYIRGNYFIPDARKGWIPFALKAAKKLLKEESFSYLITTGPPHSTHLVGLALKDTYPISWWADFRDPWADLFYNASLYRTQKSIAKDRALEKAVLEKADGILTTLGGKLHDQLKVIAPKQTFTALPNGYDADLMASVEGMPPKRIFHVVFTGLLTQNQEYDSVIKALSKFQAKHAIQLSLAGQISTEIYTEIQKALPYIKVINRGYLSHKEAVQLMKSAHLLLNFIFKGAQTQMISGKLLEYMATGAPILSIGDPDSEAGRFLMQGSCAKMLKAEQAFEMEVFIESLLKANGTLTNRFPALADWSRKALCKRLEKVILMGKEA